MNKAGKRINIAFCFDENMMKQACVTIASLLDYKAEGTHFNIFCVCSKEALRIRNYLNEIIKSRDPYSKLLMKVNRVDYSQGFEIRGITVSTYFRLNLHTMFPKVDKMIYSDVDILFNDDIMPVWEYDLGENYIAGVKADVNIREVWSRHLKDEYWKEFSDWYGKYVNAGFILMNLRKIREDKMEEKWSVMTQNKYFFQDQDIINLTCKPNIGFLPMRYNRFMFYTNEELDELRRNKIVTREELEYAINKPAVIHYAGGKPWNKYSIAGGDLWWNYLEQQKELERIFRWDVFKYKTTQIFRKK